MTFAKPVVIALLVLSVFSGCATDVTAPYGGENLILPKITQLTRWQKFDNSDGAMRSTMWQRPGERWEDTFALTIAPLEQQDIGLNRAIFDGPGVEHCAVFVSEVMQHPSSADYPSLFWQTKCIEKGKITTRLLHLMIVGKERFYHVQKVWRNPTDPETFDQWRSYLLETTLCDLSKPDTECGKS